MIVPSPPDCLDKPPLNNFCLYESLFYVSLLWFLIPGLIVRFLKKHGLSLSHITPRGMCHLVSILVLSYECDAEVGVHHLQNLLEYRKVPDSGTYYISNKKRQKIIEGFGSKDNDWGTHFFFVPINDATVDRDCLGVVKMS